MSSADKKIFHFFDLPRELRDEVLSWVRGSLKTSQRIEGFCCIRGVRFTTYRVNVLLVSRQFSQEYQQTLRRDPDFQSIVVNACHVGDGPKQQLSVQPLLRRRLLEIRNLRIGIPGRVLYADTAEEIGRGDRQRLQSDMMTLLGSMPMLKNFQVDSVVGSCWMDFYLTHVGTVPQLCTMTLDHWLFQDLPSKRLDELKLEIRLVMVGKLFQANPRCVDAGTARRLLESTENEIFYVCKPSQDANNYRGMDLEVVGPVGSFESAWAEATAERSAS